MISVCIAINDNNISCLQYLLRSMEHKMSLVSEILIADFNYRGLAQDWSFELGGVPVTQFKYDYPITDCYCHAVGLHQCMKRAKNDHLLLMDHDVVILKKNFDQLYLDTFEKHKLMILGLQHYKANHKQAFLNFPTVITAMVKRSELPPSDWLAGQLKYRHSINPWENDPADNYPVQHENFYLIQTPVPSKMAMFPNPGGRFDTGCNFWIWATEKNGRWMSFMKSLAGRQLGPGPAIYTTNNINNFGLEDNMGGQQLLFHSGVYKDRHQILKKWAETSLALD